MIINWLKNALIALLLHAGAAVAFNRENPAPAADPIAPAQACAVPAPVVPAATARRSSHSDDSGVHS
ncbi:MAG: hypothetical protein RLZZ227_1302 [Pseudomonadota bacterium]|jgi:hypothetical protein